MCAAANVSSPRSGATRSIPGSNVVDVCVGRLRSKLGGDVIETVRNVGYRFHAP